GGVYDGESATGNGDVISAGRAQYDFWDPEPGHYMNGTFYGDKNVLAVGGAIQGQSGNAAWNGDFLMERKLGGGGAVSVEAEFGRHDKLGATTPTTPSTRAATSSAATCFRRWPASPAASKSSASSRTRRSRRASPRRIPTTRRRPPK